MKIYFERSGGFAGMKLMLNLDLDELPADDATTLENLVDEADIFNRSEPDASLGYPDGFQYTITVELESQQRTLQFSDETLPEELQPLVSELSARARSQRRNL
jgi:hypothetical protein